jgi:single-stranded-DNA-specific exonuclease
MRADELDTSLKNLLPPEALTGTTEAAILLADAIEAGARMVIVADYDCDGATACAVGVRALRAFGADVHYLVPDRVTLGYGLTPAMVEIAARLEPDVLITVDNGIASVEGIAAARAHGMATVITDHHLPGDVLPEADVIVNPNQPGCDFPSKALAGVGAMFYTMLALRAELRERGAFAGAKEPNLADLLDLVALGTVADVVKLDRNNRILVAQGLARMRAGRLQAGIRALFALAGRDPARAGTTDLGFMIGPRLNAAGRLSDMSLGIECLITDDAGRAMNIAQELDKLNRERRSIEAGMQEEALTRLEGFDAGNRATVALFEPDWHQGVIGIVAGRIKERLHRPTIAFARANRRRAQGLRALDPRPAPARRARPRHQAPSRPDRALRRPRHGRRPDHPRIASSPRFDAAFEQVCRELIDPAQLERTLDTDGSLESGYFALDAVRMLAATRSGARPFRRRCSTTVFEVLSASASSRTSTSSSSCARASRASMRSSSISPRPPRRIASMPPFASISTNGTGARQCSCCWSISNRTDAQRDARRRRPPQFAAIDSARISSAGPGAPNRFP